MQTLSGQTVVCASDGVVTAGVTDDLVLLDVKHSIYYGLTETGAFIWQLLQEPRSVEEIERLVLAEYQDVAKERAEAEVHDLLEDLARHDLIVTRRSSRTGTT